MAGSRIPTDRSHRLAFRWRAGITRELGTLDVGWRERAGDERDCDCGKEAAEEGRPGRQERTGGITMTLIVLGVVLPWLAIGLGGWFGFQLLRQNGRLLFRLQALEQRLAQLPTAPGPSLQPAPSGPHGLSVGS